jgi:hypothetical protein
MIKQTGRYVAQTEGGERHVVIEFTEYIDVGGKDGPEQIPGMKELRLEGGGRVNYIDDDTFEIVQSRTILKRVR